MDGEKSAIIITHHREILKEIHPDFVHVINNGRIVTEGGDEIIDRIEEEGFGWIKDEQHA